MRLRDGDQVDQTDARGGERREPRLKRKHKEVGRKRRSGRALEGYAELDVNLRNQIRCEHLTLRLEGFIDVAVISRDGEDPKDQLCFR